MVLRVNYYYFISTFYCHFIYNIIIVYIVVCYYMPISKYTDMITRDHLNVLMHYIINQLYYFFLFICTYIVLSLL